MKIRNTVSQAVFNYELAEGRELIAKYPHLKIEQVNAEEKKALEQKTVPTAEDKILGKTAAAKEETAIDAQSNAAGAQQDEQTDETPALETVDETTLESEETGENLVSEVAETVKTDNLQAPKEMIVPTPDEDKILGKNNKKAGN